MAAVTSTLCCHTWEVSWDTWNTCHLQSRAGQSLWAGQQGRCQQSCCNLQAEPLGWGPWLGHRITQCLRKPAWGTQLCPSATSPGSQMGLLC